MPEPVFGLTSNSAKLLNEMAKKHRQRLPDVGRRTRRVYPPSRTSTTTTGGSVASAGCGCGTIEEPEDGVTVGSCVASRLYRMSITCGQSVLMLRDDSEEKWLACPTTACDESISVEMSASGTDTGNVTVIVTGDLSHSWESALPWHPLMPLRMKPASDSADCSCGWTPEPCLIPVDFKKEFPCLGVCIDEERLINGYPPGYNLDDGTPCLDRIAETPRTWESDSYEITCDGDTVEVYNYASVNDDGVFTRTVRRVDDDTVLRTYIGQVGEPECGVLLTLQPGAACPGGECFLCMSPVAGVGSSGGCGNIALDGCLCSDFGEDAAFMVSVEVTLGSPTLADSYPGTWPNIREIAKRIFPGNGNIGVHTDELNDMLNGASVCSGSAPLNDCEATIAGADVGELTVYKFNTVPSPTPVTPVSIWVSSGIVLSIDKTAAGPGKIRISGSGAVNNTQWPVSDGGWTPPQANTQWFNFGYSFSVDVDWTECADSVSASGSLLSGAGIGSGSSVTVTITKVT